MRVRWAFRIGSWVRWRLKARGRHGLHAPLLYAWADRVRAVQLHPAVEAERRKLRNEQEELQGKDPGVGSPTRGRSTVAKVARVALKPPGHVRALLALAEVGGARNVLELGTCFGVTAAHFAASGFQVRTVEGHAGRAGRAQAGWERAGQSGRVALEVCTFDTALAQWEALQPRPQWDFIFLDGHHEGAAMRGYLRRLRPLLSSAGCIVCDDIHGSPDMESAWEAARLGWRTTADAFAFGVLFNRTDLTPGHFSIRLPGTNFGG